MGLKVSGDGQLEEAEDGVQVVDVGERAEERDTFVDTTHVPERVKLTFSVKMSGLSV